MPALLELDHVGLSYHTLSGEIQALSQISFSVQEGEFVSLVGPSGCGKSTVLNLIAGLLIPEQGQITMQGLPREHSVLSVGYMLQKDHLFEWLTIYENVLLGLKIQKRKTKESISHVDRLLQEYGLWNFRFSHPSQLSGGMRQRAALIRTLALEPALLLLDEPFSALDYQTRLSVSDDIWKILRKEGKTALLVTHDISEAISMSDRVIILSKAPACVRCEFPILTTLADRTPMQMRNAPEFKQYFQQIWKELNRDTWIICTTVFLKTQKTAVYLPDATGCLSGFLLLWEVSARLGFIDSFIFGSPGQVCLAFRTLLLTNHLLSHIGITVFETLASFFLVVVFSLFFSVLLWLCPRLAAILEPYLVVLNSLPKSALAPLLPDRVAGSQL